MADQGNDRLKSGVRSDSRRAARLAAELRENLRRRKAQARQRSAHEGSETEQAGEPAKLPDER